MNNIKAGVRVYGIQPEMVLVDNIVQSIFEGFEEDCRRTSIVGKKHKKGSLHDVSGDLEKPKGYAIDYGTKQISSRGVKYQIFHMLKQKLPQCDILFEHEGGEQEHFHVEFDPKDDLIFQKHKAIYKQTGRWPE